MTTPHASLTGADLHEPKGIETAAANTVYVCNGSGSGTWSAGSVLLGITGMIADFATPIAPNGWLECNGSAISRTTYSTLFAAVTIQQSGTRASGTKIINGLSTTGNLAAGYYVSGAGIPTGAVIVTVDSAVQITIDQNATSSGTSTVICSPFPLGDGSTTFNVPDTATKYRRGRNVVSMPMGTIQSDQIKSHGHAGSTVTMAGSNAPDTTHTHLVSGSTDNVATNHTHNVSITSGIQSVDHTHHIAGSTGSADRTLDHTHSEHTTAIIGSGQTIAGGATISNTTTTSGTSSLGTMDHLHALNLDTGGMSISHTHLVSGTSDIQNSTHLHTMSFTSGAGSSHTHTWTQGVTTVSIAASTAGTIDETRPNSVVVLTCIKS